ncbi:MAG: hypothetical protein IJE26_05760, partial [Oscillospiraceae bacterium]|nr:hypothetical protein [Oscillospiraceae bacterium]
MNRKTHKKTLFLVAVAAVCLLSVTALAAGYVPGWCSHSTGEAKTPPALTDFENGYAYESGQNFTNEITGEDGSVDTFESVSYVYERNGEEVWFSQDKPAKPIAPMGVFLESVEGIDLYYYCYTNVAVPADYELTEADKAAEAAGEIIFSYGSEKVTRMEIQSLQWSDHGVLSCLMQMDGSLTPEELAAMAKEIIAK